MAQFVLYINTQTQVIEYPLPPVHNRSLRLSLDREIPGLYLHFEVYDGQWTLLARDGLHIRSRNQDLQEKTLEAQDVLQLRLGGLRLVVLVLEQNRELTSFRKYDISARKEVTIGSGPGCDLCINDPFISATHAVLRREGGGHVLIDQSKNGIYVNTRRVQGRCSVRPFDVIHTVGLKLIFLGDVIAVNMSGSVRSRLPGGRSADIVPAQLRSEEPYHAAPQAAQPLDCSEVVLDPPPKPGREKQQSMLFLLGPMATMPIPILAAILIRVNLYSGSAMGSGMYIAMVVSVMLSALIGIAWAMGRKKASDREAEEAEAKRESTYRAYLEEQSLRLRTQQEHNREILCRRHRSTAELMEEEALQRHLLWSRRSSQEDFLVLRLGTGVGLHAGAIQTPRRAFSVEEDPLSALPEELVSRFRRMGQVPFLLDLKGKKLVGVTGSGAETAAAARCIALQAAALHSDELLRIAVLCEEKTLHLYRWMRWLPHTLQGDQKLRLFSGDERSRQNVLYALTEELRRRSERLRDREEPALLPHYLVFCTSDALFAGESLASYLRSEEELGVTFVLLYENRFRLPGECGYVLEAGPERWCGCSLERERDETNSFAPEYPDVEQADAFARRMSAMTARRQNGNGMPASIDYLEMLGIRRLEQWKLLRRYKENRVYEGISAALGIGAGGEVLSLDLHEKKHGPHGLIAGTTGSGKSEVIQTLILSLMMNYPPEQVSFILIDYKGGGMANAFAGSPHLAGTITNLGEDGGETFDETQTHRALVSVRSEIQRRQKLFNRCRVNHIDQYIRLFRTQQAEEPLPHLILISDEFAELRREQPQFIKELISAARVGRSLGIHLILATQRPGGVVDEEIWSNSRFKLCLRVQDKQDSMGVLHRAEAAELKRAGQAYLQIGNDEFFEQLQVAYSGTAYAPEEREEDRLREEVALIGLDGSSARVFREREETDSQTQLEACLRFIAKTCREAGIPATRQLWMPPLPLRLEASALPVPESAAPFRLPFGLVDDPACQRQFPAELDLMQCGNTVICGAPGSGKSTLLQTILRRAVERCTPRQVQLYALDFSGGMLAPFAQVPHCGGVCTENDGEKAASLFRLLRQELRRRQDCFSQAGVGSYRSYAAEHEMPVILVVLDGLATFRERMSALQEELFLLSRESVHCGILLLLTANYSNELHYKLKQNLTTVISLSVAEPIQYYDLYNHRPEILPNKRPGRGMVEQDGRLLEFQAALPAEGESEGERFQCLRGVLEALGRGAQTPRAPQIPVLPREEHFARFWAKHSDAAPGIPLGYDVESILPVALAPERLYCFAVSGQEQAGIDNALINLAYGWGKRGATLYLTELEGGIPLNLPVSLRCRDYEGVRQMLIELKAQFKRRSALERQGAFVPEQEQPICVFIDSMAAFCSLIYRGSNPEALSPITELFLERGKGLGIRFFAAFGPQSQQSTTLNSRLCRLFLAEKHGLHLGGRVERQRLFDYRRSARERSRALEENVGYLTPNLGGATVWIPWREQED